MVVPNKDISVENSEINDTDSNKKDFENVTKPSENKDSNSNDDNSSSQVVVPSPLVVQSPPAHLDQGFGSDLCDSSDHGSDNNWGSNKRVEAV
jgi:hypothetical protein